MSNDFEARARRAVFDRLDTAMAEVASLFEDIGEDTLNLERLREPVEAVLRNYLTASEEEDSRGSAPILKLGEEDACPPALTRSMVFFAIGRHLEKVREAVKSLEQAEDAKLEKWLIRKTGVQSHSVDFNALEVWPYGQQLVEILGIVWSTMQADRQEMERVAAKFKDASGFQAFAADLSIARLQDPRAEALLPAMWQAATAEDIDKVLEDEEIRASPHLRPIRLFAEAMKKLLELPEEAQAAARREITKKD